MSIIRVILVLNHICFCKQFLFISRDSQDDTSVACVVDIIKAYYKPKSQLTIIDGDNSRILPAINKLSYVSLFLLNTNKNIVLPYNSGYLIIANNWEDFISKFNHITREFSWNPNAKMLILLKKINNHALRNIFDNLLKEHAVDVVVINDTVSVDLYTYNPYENFGCGRRYDRIIQLGYCYQQSEHPIFYDKLVTGLQNCTVQVISSHLPPHSIDPTRNESEQAGIEQFILNSLGEKEKFRVNFTYTQDVDEFTVIADNKSAVGPMSALQKGEADVFNGAMLLTYERTQAFTYLTGGETFTDYLHLHVATTNSVSNLKSIYSGFDCLVWLALLIVFVIYSVLMHFIMRKKSEQAVVLKMFGYLLLQSSQIKGNRFERVFIFWVFFAYLINCYYQSSLVSMTTHPHLDYQIATVEDVVKYNLKPCISTSIRRITTDARTDVDFARNNDARCEGRMESMNSVAEANDRYTIFLYSLYKYNEYDYYDEFGKSKIYTIKSPRTQILYAIYLYKGFPMREKLQKLCQRIEEGGFIRRHFRKLKSDKTKKQRFVSKVRRPHIFIPWYVLGFGCSLATLTFSIEIMINKYF